MDLAWLMYVNFTQPLYYLMPCENVHVRGQKG